VIGNDTFVTHGRLPHLAKPDKTFYVTFCTKNRRVLTPDERDHVFRCSLFGNGRVHYLHCACVMPDHVHLILKPYDHATIAKIAGAIKSISSRLIADARRLRRPLWQRESFDRIIRSSENLRQKCEYVANNPVRAGLVSTPDEYPWLYRVWADANRRP